MIGRLRHQYPALERLGALRERMRTRELPVITQVSAAECGAACLAMVLGMYGKRCSLEQIRQDVGCNRDGASAHAILEAARRHGLRGRGIKLEPEDLRLVPRGTILHWEFAHFVVLERVRGERIEIIDPAYGRRSVSLAEFGDAFTGVALQLEPSAQF
jgi:ATP-binding cassette subfamily B protein